MAHMDVVAAAERLTMAEEGAMAPSRDRGAMFRRAGAASLGFAMLMIGVLSLKQGAPQPAALSPDIRALIQKSTEQVEAMVQQGEDLRRLAASDACTKDYNGHILKAVGRVTAQALKVAMSCLDPNAAACTDAKAESESLVQDMKDECVQEPSTDICTQSGDDMASVDVCVPKTCQNAADLDELALGDTSITCGGGIGGIFAPILNAVHFPWPR